MPVGRHQQAPERTPRRRVDESDKPIRRLHTRIPPGRQDGRSDDPHAKDLFVGVHGEPSFPDRLEPFIQFVISGDDASGFVNYATVKDVTDQKVGEVWFTPMVNEAGKVALEGLTFRLSRDRYLFIQSGAMPWLEHLREVTGMDVQLEDVTPDFTCFAVQGPRSSEVVEAVLDEVVDDIGFSEFRKTAALDTYVIVDRQGVTGEEGFELLMRTDSGQAPALWRAIREEGEEYGLRELGFRAQEIGHTEAGYATAIRDYLPARFPPEDARRFARHWTSREELDAFDGDFQEFFCSPAELGWASRIDLDGEFHGRQALAEEAGAGGPDRRFVGLIWDSEEVGDLFAAQFRNVDAAPPPNMASGQHRMLYLKVFRDGQQVGWASGANYSPNLRRMISNGRLDREAAEPGTEVGVGWGGFTNEPSRVLTAEVVKQPIIDHRK